MTVQRNGSMASRPFKVLVVGAGMGGLACAISCLRQGLEVDILERAPELSQVGAGIQIPPNACRVFQHFGLEQELRNAGAVEANRNTMRRYSDGKVLCVRLGRERMREEFNAPWYVIHRADYQSVLLNEALRLGCNLRTDAEVVSVDFSLEEPYVMLKNGEKVTGDVVVGADGLWSNIRDMILEKHSPPLETGDLAYRGTFSREQLEAFNDPRINEMIKDGNGSVWVGPHRHSVFYAVKGGTAFNLVLIRPDDLPPGSRTADGDIGEMRMTYEGWDPILTKIISCIPSVLKWKLCHHEELRTWTKGNVVLIGDASHPTLPYQAQGAAMAVEDGLVLGLLLGRLHSTQAIPDARKRASISRVLQLFESLRKQRTTIIVKGAIQNRTFFHMPDGEEQEARDRALAEVDWVKPCVWQWADIGYQKKMLGFDMVTDTHRAFEAWVEGVDGG